MDIEKLKKAIDNATTLERKSVDVLIDCAKAVIDGEYISKDSLPTEEEIARAIHTTREWQALHLEVVPEILENVKNGLAKAIHYRIHGEQK